MATSYAPYATREDQHIAQASGPGNWDRLIAHMLSGERDSMLPILMDIYCPDSETGYFFLLQLDEAPMAFGDMGQPVPDRWEIIRRLPFRPPGFVSQDPDKVHQMFFQALASRDWTKVIPIFAGGTGAQANLREQLDPYVNDPLRAFHILWYWWNHKDLTIPQAATQLGYKPRTNFFGKPIQRVVSPDQVEKVKVDFTDASATLQRLSNAAPPALRRWIGQHQPGLVKWVQTAIGQHVLDPNRVTQTNLYALRSFITMNKGDVILQYARGDGAHFKRCTQAGLLVLNANGKWQVTPLGHQLLARHNL